MENDFGRTTIKARANYLVATETEYELAKSLVIAHDRIAELEYNHAEYKRLHAELAKHIGYDAPAPSLCDLVAEVSSIMYSISDEASF